MIVPNHQSLSIKLPQEMLIEVADLEALVMDVIPLPQLHIMMGATNHLYNIIRRHMIKVIATDMYFE